MSYKIVTLLIAVVMIGLTYSPLKFGIFYLLFRPLVQPYAMEQYTLLPGIPVTGVFAVILIAYSFIAGILKRGFTLFAPNIVFLYVLLFLAVASFINTWDYLLSIRNVLKFSTALAMYILIYNSVQDVSDAKKVVYAIVFTSIIPMLYGYYEYFAGTGGYGLHGVANRIRSVMGMPNSYGELLSICFCATLILLLQGEKGKKRVLLICVLASNIISSILALNRGSWIALSFALFLSYLGYRKEVKARWFIIGTVAVLIVFAGTMAARFEQLDEVKPWGGTRDTFQGRVEMWKGLIMLIPEHPVIGFGIGTAELVTEKFYKIKNWPHNDYVRLAIEVGVPALLFYVGFLIKQLLTCFRLMTDKTLWYVNFPFMTAVLYWVIISSAQNIVYDVTIFPIFLALVAACKKWNELSYHEATKM